MRNLALVALVLGLAGCATQPAGDVKQVAISEANRQELQRRVREGRELTGEEIRLLDAYLARQAGGQLPAGRTIGELIAEQRGFEAAQAATPQRVADAASPAASEAAAEAGAAPEAPSPTREPRREPARPKPAPPATAATPKPEPTPTAATASATPAPPEPAATPVRPTPPPEVVVPSGTPLKVRLEDALSTKTNQPGDPFRTTLAEDLTAGGRLLARRGSVVEGRVTESVRSGKVKGRAQMSLQLASIRIEGRSHALVTQPIHFEAESSKGEDVKKVGIGAAAGAIVGAIAGGKKGAAIGTGVGAAAGGGVVLLTRGEEVELAVEQALEFTLAERLRLTEIAAPR